MKTLLLAVAAAASLGTTSLSAVDETIPSTKLEIHGSLAESLGEYSGRALLIEFFAHW